MATEKFVFRNKKKEREYTFENVHFILKIRGQKDKRFVGASKEQLFENLLTKNRLTKRTQLESKEYVYQIKEFEYSKYGRFGEDKFQYMKDEQFYIELWLGKKK